MELAEGNFVLDNLAAALEFSRCFNHSLILKLVSVAVKTSSHSFWTGPNRPICVNPTKFRAVRDTAIWVFREQAMPKHVKHMRHAIGFTCYRGTSFDAGTIDPVARILSRA